MIRIQKLKEPKKTSGKKLETGKLIVMDKIEIRNLGKAAVYIDSYQRKKPAVKTTSAKK